MSEVETLRLTPDSLTFNEKINTAIERIKEFEPEEGYYLAFSGGKDSQVIYELTMMAGVKYDSHFNFTTVDPPELLRFIRENYPDVQWGRPEKTMWQLIPQKIYPPTRVVRYCCDWLKERGGKGRFILTGIRKAESFKRSKRRMMESCFAKSQRFLHPIFDWTEKDVWDFIKKQNLKYCELYNQGYKRIGCVGCSMAGREGMLKDFARWPNFRRAYLKAFEKMLEVRRERNLETQWQTAEEVMEWWLQDRKEKIDPNQLRIFSD